MHLALCAASERHQQALSLDFLPSKRGSRALIIGKQKALRAFQGGQRTNGSQVVDLCFVGLSEEEIFAANGNLGLRTRLLISSEGAAVPFRG